MEVIAKSAEITSAEITSAEIARADGAAREHFMMRFS
jgi:hypothetical protein